MDFFTLGELKLSFKKESPQNTSQPLPLPLSPKDEVEMRKVSTPAQIEEKFREEENRLDLLMVTDPLKYEEMIANDELVDDETQIQH